MKNKESVKKIQDAVDKRDDQLREIAQRIHSHPELAFEEYKAVNWLTKPLEESGFNVKKGVADLETSFIATWEGEPGGPTIGLLAEYDALPDIGHACGHNIIGTSAVGAALSLKDSFPNLQGKIKVIGTPAEEDGGGKILMAEGGVFDDLDIAMMCHPKNSSMVIRGGLACVTSVFKFFGRESHASSAPEYGISALDAMINSFIAINSLREYMEDDVRIHGIITNGGSAPNIVPGYCEATFIIRALTTEKLHELKEKVYQAARGSASAVGVKCEIEEGLIYAERNDNTALANIFKEQLEVMGVEVNDPPKKGGIGSSDIGNVSQITPTIHPYIKIGDAYNHTRQFTQDAISEEGMKGLNLASKALAMTAYELCVNTSALEKVHEEFNGWKISGDNNKPNLS